MIRLKLLCGTLGLAVPSIVSAAVIPVAITGYNQDIVVDTGTVGPDLRGVVTATMDAGTAETGGTYYQTGFVTASPGTGLPSGTVVTSATGNGTFALAPANTNNALLLNNAAPSGTLTLTAPAVYNQLAFYNATGNGTGDISYTINYVGGGTQTGSFTSPDWFGGSPTAFTTSGRVQNVVTGATDNVGGTNPRVYEQLVNLTNTTAAVQSIQFTRGTANGNTAILAVSGQVVPEPASLSLLAVGGLGLLARRRRMMTT